MATTVGSFSPNPFSDLSKPIDTSQLLGTSVSLTGGNNGQSSGNGFHPLSSIWNWLQKPGQEMQKSADLTQKQLGDLNAWYNSEYYKDYMQSAEARSTMSSLTDQVKKILMAYNNKAVATGATDESRVAAKTGAQNSMSDAINRISGIGSQRKDATRRDYMNYSGLLSKQMSDIYQNKAQGYQQQQDNLFNGGIDLATALFSGGGKGGGVDLSSLLPLLTSAL
jgi:hypothetical protein